MTANVEELRASALETFKRIGMHQTTASEHLRTMMHEQELASQAVARAEAARHALEGIEAMIAADTAEYDAKMVELARQQHALSCMRREGNMMLVLAAYRQEPKSPEVPLLPVSSSTAHCDTANMTLAEQSRTSPSMSIESLQAGWVSDSDTEPTEPAEQRRKHPRKRRLSGLDSTFFGHRRRKVDPARRDRIAEIRQARRNASAAGIADDILQGIEEQHAQSEEQHAQQEELNAQPEEQHAQLLGLNQEEQNAQPEEQNAQPEEQNAQQEDWEM